MDFLSVTPKRLRVFLCYASDDRPRIRGLYERLLSCADIDLWFDEAKLLPGQDWDYEIARALEASDVVIVCLSNSAVMKEGYVQKEIKHAVDVAREKPDGTIFVIPLRLEQCEVPRSLRRWQWIDLFQPAAFDKLLRALTERACTITARAGRTRREEVESDIEDVAARTPRPHIGAALWSELAQRQPGSTRPKVWPLLVWATLLVAGVVAGLLGGFSRLDGLQLLAALVIFLVPGSTEYIGEVVSYWFFGKLCIVVRAQHVAELEEFGDYEVHLSFVNRQNRPLALNSVLMHMGDYAFGGPPWFCWIGVKTFEHDLQLAFVGHSDGQAFPLVKEVKSESSMGSATFVLIGERGLLAPREQVDIRLRVTLKRPASFSGRYPTVWSLGGQVEARYDGRNLKEKMIRYPARRRLSEVSPNVFRG